ncbi:MAG: helix-turn-helix transcriptional regulator [Candidatus Aminicenantes bacterium]|nr:helix-turn-helix transcriptional regulator [Candidatus Aminicenantes bacterium]
MKLQNRLKVLRAAKSVTQDDLAQAVEVSRQTINAIELGKFNPSVMTALKLARFFGTPVEEIFAIVEEERHEENR